MNGFTPLSDAAETQQALPAMVAPDRAIEPRILYPRRSGRGYPQKIFETPCHIYLARAHSINVRESERINCPYRVSSDSGGFVMNGPFFYDHARGEGGNVWDLAMRMSKHDKRQALMSLVEAAGLPPTDFPQCERFVNQCEIAVAALDKVRKAFAISSSTTPDEVRDYLRSRMVTPRTEALFSFVPRGHLRDVLSPEEIRLTGLGTREGLLVLWYKERGRPVYYCTRDIRSKDFKKASRSDGVLPHPIWNVDVLYSEPNVVWGEGMFDCTSIIEMGYGAAGEITCHLIGAHKAVLLEALRWRQREHPDWTFTICLDNDAASPDGKRPGNDAAERMVRWLLDSKVDVRWVRHEPGSEKVDINLLHQQGREEEIRGLISSARLISEHDKLCPIRRTSGSDDEAAECPASSPLPEMKMLADLVRHPEGMDPNELICRRYLCRGGSVLFVGPTGVGKSSFIMQCAILWACGRPAFGLEPVRPLRILIVQAENDDGDLAEMRDGVLAGLDLPQDARDAALSRIRVATEDAKTREEFASMLDQLLAQEPVDMVFVDPALAYIGGDAGAQRDATPFLRNMLNPVIHRHRVGLILSHHANKPPSGEQKPQWQAGDYAYLGAGSAEFANWARAVIAIRSIGSDEVFELRLAKRGRRAGWKDAQGRPVYTRYIAYHREPDVICWREVTPAEVEALTGGGEPSIQDVVDALANGPKETPELAAAISAATGLKDRAARNLIDKAKAEQVVCVVSKGNRGVLLYRSTGKMPARVPVRDTPEEGNEKEP